MRNCATRGSTIDGHVSLEMSDGETYVWRCIGDRPWKDLKLAKDARERLTDASNRAALLDYRSLLRTNFGAINLKQRLFELAVTTLLANAPVAVAGGRERTIGQLWQALWDTVPQNRERHTKSRLKSLVAAEKVFNDALKGILPDVQSKAGEFLGYFDDSNLELTLGFSGVSYNQVHKDFDRKEMDFEVKLHGVAVAEWNDLLNEARLTALALSLYLAGAALANTTPPVGAPTPLRVLALDDVCDQ